MTLLVLMTLKAIYHVNFVLRRRVSERISDDILPQMTNLNMVIPILMYFLTITHQKQVFASKH